MTNFQKTIKYIAYALAICLIVSIISSIIGLFESITTTVKNDDEEITTVLEGNNPEINSLNIDLKLSNLVIESGDKLVVKTDRDYIKIKKNNNKVTIKEKNHITKDRYILVITVPSTMFEEVNIETGAGSVQIEKLITNKLNIDLGAGKLNIDYLEVASHADIDGGAGKITINDGKINNFDLDIGAGETNIKSALFGKSEIDCGVGNLNLNLIGNLSNYKFDIEKGIGTIQVNENSIAGNGIVGEGNNEIEIDGGVGSIKIKTDK